MSSRLRLLFVTLLSLGGTAGAQTFTVTISAANGHVIKNPDKSSYQAGDTVELIGRPDIGYYFAGWSGDIRGIGLMYKVPIKADMKITAHFNPWKPPIGIPAPEFGISEKHTMYSGKTFDFGSGPLPYKTGANGPYTHYVDASHAIATDTDNPYGSVEKPRKSFPTNITAGSVVELHHGPYQITLQKLKGTADRPIFIRGANNSETFIANELTGGSYNVMNSEYVIVEHAVFDGARLQIGHLASHISFRHCEIDGNGNTAGVYLWTQKDTFIPGQLKKHIVFYGNTIHDCGKYPATSESVCAFMIDNTTQNVWIVDNHIFHNGEDGVHILDRSGLPANTPKADRIFIGRNVFHHDIENAIDVKGSTNIIISQNDMYGYDALVAASNGDAIRINDEGFQDNIWILFNRIHDGKWGIGAYDAEDPPYIIGNIMHNLNAAVSWGGTGDVIGNVVYNCESGIDAGSGTKTIANNIVAVTNTKPISGGTDVRNNMFWRNGAKVSNAFGVEADPLFRDAGNYDFSIKSGSSAIDKGSPDAIEKICGEFEKLYGLNLRYDFAYNKRPFGNGWDIGAYEYISTDMGTPSGIKGSKDVSTVTMLLKNGRLCIPFISEKESNAVLRIYNLNGALLKKTYFFMKNGSNQVVVDRILNDSNEIGTGCFIITVQAY